jgi:hypothetical protein
MVSEIAGFPIWSLGTGLFLVQSGARSAEMAAAKLPDRQPFIVPRRLPPDQLAKHENQHAAYQVPIHAVPADLAASHLAAKSTCVIRGKSGYHALMNSSRNHASSFRLPPGSVRLSPTRHARPTRITKIGKLLAAECCDPLGLSPKSPALPLRAVTRAFW